MSGRPRFLPRDLLVHLIRFYQLAISPWFPQRCRFYPSCSMYMLRSVQRFGVIQGSWHGMRRLSRCHPWNPGGVDDVPSVPVRGGATAAQGTTLRENSRFRDHSYGQPTRSLSN